MSLALALAAALISVQDAPTALLTRVEQSYKQGDLSAKFTQTYVEKLRGKKTTERGQLWAKRDGRVRWSYEDPTPKHFIYTGKTAYFYEPESAQVTEFESFQDNPLWSALRFLWGQGKLSESFDVQGCDARCPAAESGTVAVKLLPKKPLAAVRDLVLVIDEAQARVRRSIVYDTLGNRTEYQFDDVKVGERVPDQKFQFTPPAGVQTLRASGT